MARRMGRRVSVLLLVAVPTALFADVLLLGTNFYIRDLYRYHFPMKSAVREEDSSSSSS